MAVKILFVCLGNICRSPAAEAVMRRRLYDNGLADEVFVDSAGTGDWHVGETADRRMRMAARKRGYDLTSIARQVGRRDFDEFDYIVAMDNTNYKDLCALQRDTSHRAHLCKMTDFCSRHDVDAVPDPYYGGDDGFEKVLDILEDATEGLLDKLEQEHLA